ncbi:MAG TPA: ribbon-helix-helix protein, CopG family [Anaerolineae bacterium]|nr:ribbon-helix-helix protein, CopG family [Anaerolineae bacterium]
MTTLAADNTMRKVMFTAPPDLLVKLDAKVDQLGTNRSQLIRQAIEYYLENVRRQELRTQLEEGYRMYAARDLQISEAFKYADYEVTVQYVPPNDETEADEW